MLFFVHTVLQGTLKMVTSAKIRLPILVRPTIPVRLLLIQGIGVSLMMLEIGIIVQVNHTVLLGMYGQ